MHSLSMTQALSIWSDLEAAYYGKNGFGGDTAEIYIYRAMPYDPSVARIEHASTVDIMDGDGAGSTYDRANESLHALFAHFSKTHEARIEVEGRELGEWLKTARYLHRIHVKVVFR
jgi:hypothetical protein